MKVIKKDDNNLKYDRINIIYKTLLSHPDGMSVTDLSEQLNVSSRTILRDFKEVLVNFGAIKDGKLWRIDPTRAQDDLQMEERIVLGILDSMAKSKGNIFYSKAHPLLQQVSQQLDQPISTNLNCEDINEDGILLFVEIENAIKEQIEIEIEYNKKMFFLQPLKLAFFDGYGYLLALDTKKKNKFKKFHLNSISNLKTTGRKFEVSKDISKKIKYANSAWFDLDNEFIVNLFISKEIKKYFERKPLPSQRLMGEDPDGSIEIEINITHKMEILPTIFEYIPHIKVLSPKWLADEVVEEVQGYLKDIT
jgi:predicted DNA-binding transcriptional regulator YafY